LNSYRKKLIEVALPLDAINRGCEEDKNRKTGHIRNLHKWFAPMPLPSWRAMLFAALVDDPGESLAGEEADRERGRLMRLVERLSAFEAYKDSELLAQAQSEITKAVGTLPPTIVDPFCGGGSALLEAQRLGLRTWVMS
jgi:putative DNA methylase